MTVKRSYRHVFPYYDVLAAVLCVLLFFWFFVSVKFGINYMDESFYMAVAQRFANGGRPFVDDWHVSQLSELLLVPFYSLLKAITGSTDGIILFMRHMFLLLDFSSYWLIYRYLRPYKTLGVLATFVFCAYVPFAMFAINYYTLSPRLLMLICCILFFGKTLSRRMLLLCGVLLSVTVLVEPPLALLYFVFSAAVLVFERKKKKDPAFGEDYAFFFCRRNWFWLSLSVAVCALAFLAFLQYKSGLKNMLSTLPELLTDSEYDFSIDGNVKTYLLSKLRQVGLVFGWGNVILSFFACLFVLILEKTGRIRRLTLHWLCFSICLLVSCFAYPLAAKLLRLDSWDNRSFFLVTPVSNYAFGWINYTLCEKKDRKLFLIWLIGVVSSVIMDTFSDVSLGICGIICIVPGLLCFRQVLKEQSEKNEMLLKGMERSGLGKKDRLRTEALLRSAKTNGTLLGVCKATLGVFLVLICVSIYLEGTFLLYEDPKTFHKMDVGPYRGIYTDASTYEGYCDTLDDLNLIKSQNNHSVAVFNSMNAHQYTFLYLDIPFANCSAWYSPKSLDRQLRYFAAFPDRRPDALYFYELDPFADVPPEEAAKRKALILELAGLLCEGTVTEGKQGIIVKVNQWKDPLRPELTEWVASHGNDLY